MPVTALTLRAGMFYLQHQEGSTGAMTLSALQTISAAVVKTIVVPVDGHYTPILAAKHCINEGT